MSPTDHKAKVFDVCKPIARAIAFYLPQFHPIPENDRWWGKGFTEWTNTTSAQPMFRGHYQPHLPADLGFYDLRVPETRVQQADMARNYGIEGFCYYHYWFAGRRLLERPFEEVLSSGSPDFPFCLCWANQTWTGVWHGLSNKTLVEQTYPGEADHRCHFATLLPAFRDPRYIRVEGKPLFVIFDPNDLPKSEDTLRLWRVMAAEAGLPGLHLVGYSTGHKEDFSNLGYDATIHSSGVRRRRWRNDWRNPWIRLSQKLYDVLGVPDRLSYAELIAEHKSQLMSDGIYPSLVHAWDNTPRSGKNGVVYQGSSPKLFGMALDLAVHAVLNRPTDRRIVFLKSWNEWAEGNHLEPDQRYGSAYLEAVANVLMPSSAD